MPQVEGAVRKVLLGLVGAEGGGALAVGLYFEGLFDHVEDEALHSFLVGLHHGGNAA